MKRKIFKRVAVAAVIAIGASLMIRSNEFYYDPAKYGTYLEQLGIKYPTV